MKTRKILSLALALVMLLALAAPATALEYGQEYVGYTTGNTQRYRDIPVTHWAYSSIETCTQRTWFNGYPDGLFHPNDLITRGEAAKVFAVALGLTLAEDPNITFTDTSTHWAKAYIEVTKPLFPNVSNLQGTTSFRPTQTITREEAVYALLVAWRYASKTTNADLSILNMFSDTNSISEAVKPYMAVAVSEGLLSGLPDGTIAAQKGLTRSEFAALLARALNHGYGPDTTDLPAITVNKFSSETTEARMTLSGKVSPLSTGTKLTLDGSNVTLSNGSFRVTVDLELGENTFTFSSKNTYGVGDTKVVRVTRVEPFVEPEPSPAPSVEPSKQPEPSRQPQPSENPQPSEKPQPSENPQPSEKPQPSQKPDQEPSYGLEIDPNREVNRSGKCGDNLYWVLYADGELVISGKGRMDFSGPFDAPWSDFTSQIASLTVKEGVLSIGYNAFYGCRTLKKASLPEGLTSIGMSAFQATGFARISIPDSVTDIGLCAFCDSNLTRITIPDGVTFIDRSTFNGCRNLTSVTLPDSVTDIGESAFKGCYSLSHIYYGGSAQQWAEIAIAGDNDRLNSDAVTIHFNSSGN